MREGSYIHYIVQFRVPGQSRSDWATADCAHFLFDDLPFKQSQGLHGDRYRALLEPQHRVWQESGMDGFETCEQAFDVMDAIVARQLPKHERYELRVAIRQVSKTTAPVGRPRSRAVA